VSTFYHYRSRATDRHSHHALELLSRGGGSCITVGCCPSLPLIFPIWQYTFDHVAADRASICDASVSLPSTFLLLGWWSRNLCVTSRRGSTNCAAVCADWKTNLGKPNTTGFSIDLPHVGSSSGSRPERSSSCADRAEVRTSINPYQVPFDDIVSSPRGFDATSRRSLRGESPERPQAHIGAVFAFDFLVDAHPANARPKCAETTSVCSSSSPVSRGRLVRKAKQ
jgi:hypothetical protein